MTYGTIYFPTGEFYTGELVNKQPNGFGTLTFKDEASWTGKLHVRKHQARHYRTYNF